MIIDAIGLQDTLKFFQQLPQVASRAAVLSINQTTQRTGIQAARKAMLAEVAFPAGYLTPPRFDVTKLATENSLSASIQGRFTPTSLARFSTQRARFIRTGRRGRGGVTVRVSPGRSTTLNRAFLINLRNGNLGLAIRLKPGETLAHTHGAKLLTSGPLRGLALLYGPSVDQVFRTVAADITPDLLAALQTEFLRQFVRLSGAL